MNTHRLARERAVIGAALFAALGTASAAAPDLTELSIEQLMAVEVQSASKYAQNSLDAPSSVTVLSAEDFRNYGWRTLADALRSVRGYYLSYDRNYSYVGVRGFARPGDYNTRVQLLVDGYLINDSVYDTAYVGTEFPIDVDLIDRIEVVRGPASSIYGQNALFGVINVITRNPGAQPGLDLAASAASYDTYRARATYSRAFDSGLNVVLSGTWADSKGPDNFFPELADPANNNGFANGDDYDKITQAFAKASYGKFSLEAAYARRNKGLATGVFGTVLDDGRSSYTDEQTYVNLVYADVLAGDLAVFARAYYGKYQFDGDYSYDYPPLTLNQDQTVGEWWGLEARGTKPLGAHKLVFGAEYQDNMRQDQLNFDFDPFFLYLSSLQSSRRVGIYVQDEWRFAEHWTLNAGGRYDDVSYADGDWTYRLALIYRPRQETALKLLYGTASRPPNAYERFYEVPGAAAQLGNPQLGRERIRTVEGIWEQGIGENLKLTVSAYQYRMKDLIGQEDVGGALQFVNQPEVKANGVEAELEGRWRNGVMARGSVIAQSTHSSGLDLTNSPARVATLNVTAPLIPQRLNLGVEGQYVGSRRTDLGTVPGYGFANLTLRYFNDKLGYDLSLSAYNLFNRTYFDPSGLDPAVPTRDRFEQDGATYRLKLGYRF